MRTPLLLATSVAVAILSGCSSQPTVKYETVQNGPNYAGDFEGLTKFSLAKSVLLASYSDPDKKTGLNLVSTPAEAVGVDGAHPVSFMIRPADALGLKTHLKVTKRDNTDLIESVGTEIEDNRQKVIEAAGGIAVGLIGAIALAVPGDGDGKPIPAALPLAIDTEEFLNTTKTKLADTQPRKGSIAQDGVDTVGFNIKFGALPGDAIARDKFLDKIKDDPQETLFYSACRTATVTFLTEPLEGKRFSVTVADPNFVQTVKFPEKGKVDMHSACGANTSSEKSGVSSTSDLMNTFIAQAKTVREAWKTKDDSKK